MIVEEDEPHPEFENVGSGDEEDLKKLPALSQASINNISSISIKLQNLGV
jgi:hypothetical protein